MSLIWGGADRSVGAGRTTRRDLFRIAAVAAAIAAGGGLSGCTSSADPGRPDASVTAPPGVDELARTAAAADSADLLRLGARAAQTTPALAPLLDRVKAGHRAHLAALGSTSGIAATTNGPTTSTSTGTGTSTGTSTSTGTGTSTGATAGPVSARALVAAEWAAAGRALAASASTGPAMATLLVRVAASRAVHADLLSRAAKLPLPGRLQPAELAGSTTRTNTPTNTPTATGTTRAAGSRQSLADLLAGEHAATFAYGLLAARASAGQRPLAQDLWQQHLVARDYLQSQIVAAGDTPPIPAPAYDVGTAPSTPAQVAALGTRVERSLASVAASAVAGAEPDVRPLAADHLVTAARRAARWGPAEPLPGPPSAPAPTVSSTP